MSKGVPQGRLTRSAKVGKTLLQMGAGEIGYQVRRAVNPQTGGLSDHRQLQAEQLFRTLAELRGTALKAAQFLAQEGEFLPEPFAQVLAQANHQVPALNRALVRKVFFGEFGQAPEACFDPFSPTPFAAASLGQVHEARRQGQTWAVKIQYPGIADTVTDDLLLLKGLVGRLPEGKRMTQALSEVQARFVEETDYVKEVAEMQAFAQVLPPELVVVPQPLPEFCGARVITATKLAGLHLHDWLATRPSQAQRNRMGQLLLDLWEYGVTRWGRLHADPNPGNYLFLPDGRLGLLDFGCIKTLTPAFSQGYREFLQDIADLNAEKVRAFTKAHGATFYDEEESREVHLEMVRWFALPMRETTFDLALHPTYVRDGLKVLHRMSHCFDGIITDFLFIDRTWLGVFRILEQMQACVSLRPGRKLLVD